MGLVANQLPVGEVVHTLQITMKSVGVDVSRDHQNDVAGHTIEEAVDLIGAIQLTVI